jgi:hypothetical protein
MAYNKQQNNLLPIKKGKKKNALSFLDVLVDRED